MQYSFIVNTSGERHGTPRAHHLKSHQLLKVQRNKHNPDSVPIMHFDFFSFPATKQPEVNHIFKLLENHLNLVNGGHFGTGDLD